MRQWRSCWKWCFLLGLCLGYIRRTLGAFSGVTNVEPTQKDQPPPSLKRKPISKYLHVRERTEFLIVDLKETEARNDCPVKGQKHFN
jgi:hypothetical protein